MAKRKVSNLLALAVLSLLNERPMHPYEIGAVMRQRGLADSIKINTGSLYSVTEALVRNQLIEPVETLRDTKHPERTVYAVTPAGRTEFLEWLRSLIRTPFKEYPQFAAGLAFMGHLAPREAVALLAERCKLLAADVAEIRSAIEATAKFVDRLFLIEQEYSLTMREAEVKWLHQLIERIKDGTFTEQKGEQSAWKITHPDPMRPH
ncbi:MAG: PadR family transcriptional regulator [Firmicutes bacterium]|nr:PadR family transcriptional regulator [Bacillota bacterium]